ncbi:CGNR zinc finger domain-containing protein [Jatrophihabitans sp. YIM 134969]
MLFAPDTEIALGGAVELVNSAHEDPDALSTLADLDLFYATFGWTGSRRHDDTELAEVRALRPRLEAIWDADEDAVVQIVNGLLREYHALPQLIRHDYWPYHLHATSQSDPLAVRMAVEAAMAFVDVVRSGELDRLSRCAAPDCEDVLVDLSKNRSRRFCGTTCANRVNVAAFRARRAAG